MKSVRLVGFNDIVALAHPRAVTRNDEGALANQRNPRELGLGGTCQGAGEGVDVVDPEQPPPHQELGNEIPGVTDDVGGESGRHKEGCVEVLEAQSESKFATGKAARLCMLWLV